MFGLGMPSGAVCCVEVSGFHHGVCGSGAGVCVGVGRCELWLDM